MWPFRKPSRPSPRDVAAAFGKYLSAEFIEELASKKLLRLPTLQSARVDFVLIALADELWEEPRAELDAAIRLLYGKGASIETIMPPLIKAVFGLPIGPGEVAGRWPLAELAAELLSE